MINRRRLKTATYQKETSPYGCFLSSVKLILCPRTAMFFTWAQWFMVTV
jgi:hypothetical protein